MKRKPNVKPDGKTLDPRLINRRPRPGQTSPQFGAELVVDGICPQAVVAREWSRVPFGAIENVDITSTLERIEDKTRRVNAGDLSHAEAVLTAQMVTLNAMFATTVCSALLSQRRLRVRPTSRRSTFEMSNSICPSSSADRTWTA